MEDGRVRADGDADAPPAGLLIAWRVLAGEASDGVFDDLVARHREPWRRYHTLEHVAEALAAVDRLAGAADDPDAVRFAAWFHDAVYDPRQPGNEAASADVARAALGNLPAAMLDEIVRLVLLTAGHEVAEGDGNGAVLADADLAILGAGPDRYDRYAADVRAEYAHVPDEAWRAGRSAVLTGFLERSRLFRTDAGRAAWEATARANLRRELDRLAVPPPDAGAGPGPR